MQLSQDDVAPDLSSDRARRCYAAMSKHSTADVAVWIFVRVAQAHRDWLILFRSAGACARSHGNNKLPLQIVSVDFSRRPSSQNLLRMTDIEHVAQGAATDSPFASGKLVRHEGLSVVIPVYNSADALSELCARLNSVLPQLAAQFEAILVNDGSRDNSWLVIQQLCERYPWVMGVNLMRNFGQHNALLCGIRAARHDIIVTMDDDLQHPPEELPILLQKLSDGFDVVYGTPQEEQHGALRNLASRLTKLVLQGAMGAETATKVSAWRAIRRQVCRAFESYQNTFVSIDVLLTWGTTSFSW